MLFHGAVVKFGNRHEYHHDNGEQRIEVVGNGADKKLHAVVNAGTAGKAGNGGRPGRNGSDNANGSGRGVDKIGKLCAGNIVLIGDGTHDRTDGQAVEIVVHENEHAEQNRAELSANAGLNMFGGPAAEGNRSARFVEHGDNGAEKNKEDENSDVAGVGYGLHKSGADNMNKRALEIKVCIKHAAHNDTDEEGGINLLGDEGKGDCDQRRKQRPKCGVCGNFGVNGGDCLVHVFFKVFVALKIVGIAAGVVDSAEHSRVLVASDGVQVVFGRVLAFSHRHRSGGLRGRFVGGKGSEREHKQRKHRESDNDPSLFKL